MDIIASEWECLIFFSLVFYGFNRLLSCSLIQIVPVLFLVHTPVRISLCKKDMHISKSEVEIKGWTA